MLAATMDSGEESPKRRSTFYVSLDGESRHLTKIPKAIESSVNFACNTFPICNSSSKGGILSRTTSSGAFDKTQHPKHEIEATPEPGQGKVQSLSRIFETHAQCVNGQSPDQKSKKIERTRSFKTIEKFQSRFSSKKNDDNNQTTNEKEGKNLSPLIKKTSDPQIKNQRQNGTFTSLIRRTHSTKLTRSSSTLVRATGKYSGSENENLNDFNVSGTHTNLIYDDHLNCNDDEISDDRKDREDGVHSG